MAINTDSPSGAKRAYNQPGVEAGKEATRALMGAEGTIKNPAAKGLPADAATYAALRKRIEGR
ncbi:MAG: hypothetical protein WBD75_02235 [Phycisphaerae bacterium]